MIRKLINFVVTMAVLIGLLFSSSLATNSQAAEKGPQPSERVLNLDGPSGPNPPSGPDNDTAFAKLDSGLQEMVSQGKAEDVSVTIYASGTIDPSGYLKNWSSRSILEYQVYGGTINTANLLQAGKDAQVQHIEIFRPREAPEPIGEIAKDGTTTNMEDAFAGMQEKLNALMAERGLTSPNRPASTNAPQSPQDWWGAQDVHGGQAANDAGFTGEGVNVAMVDSGVDFGHPDLYGTQAVYAAGHTYAGWPIALDPMSMRTLYYNGYTFSPDDATQYSWYSDTSAWSNVDYQYPITKTNVITTEIYIDGDDISGHWYMVSQDIAKSSKSGRLRYGIHPDFALYINQGQFPGVLLVDTQVAYQYDTVYVDLNGDYWFNGNAKFDVTGDMVHTNDVDKPATKTSPILTWDDVWTTDSAITITASITDPVYIGGWTGDWPRLGPDMLVADTQVMTGTLVWQPDGKPDLSGGMIYFIADGKKPIPGSVVLNYDWDGPDTGMVPENAALVAFMLGTEYAPSGGDHGTGCSTMIVAQGVIDYPAFDGESWQVGQVQFGLAGGNTLQGLAPEASLIAVGNSYASVAGMQGFFDAYTFITVGADGVANTGDEAQVANMSFGDDSIFNDGWNLEARYLTHLSNTYPNLSMAAATGNDGPGYGTIDEPASSAGVIAVGGSTSFGATYLANWGTPSKDYIQDGDVVFFSNRGPSATGGNPDILAIGFINHVAVPVNANYDPDGNTALSVGGGTSYAAPFVAGALADIYQAYKGKWGVWPTSEQARAILMAGADDMNYDVYSQGAGNLRTDTSALIAAGQSGLFTMPSAWDAGNYRGTEYEAFPSVVSGGSASKTFTLYNTGSAAKTAALSDAFYQLKETQVFTVETAGGDEDNVEFGQSIWYNHPDYYVTTAPTLAATEVFTDPTGWIGTEVTYTVHGPDLLVDVPEGADLMRVYFNQEWQDFDEGYSENPDWNDLDYYGINDWDVAVYQWDDLDGNGWFWADPWLDASSWDEAEPDGIANPLYSWIDILQKGSSFSHMTYYFPNFWQPNFAADGESELNLINRTVGSDAVGAYIEVQDPANRGAGTTTNKGLVIGLQHIYDDYEYYGPQTIKVTVEFYQATDWGWVSLNQASMNVPAASSSAPGTATFNATVKVPTGTEAGFYEGAILVDGKVVPVSVNVAPAMDDKYYFTFGTAAEATPYRNGEVFSANQWYGGGYGNGDWRFYNFDLQDTSLFGKNAVLYYHNQWGDCKDMDPDPVVEDWVCTNMPGDLNPYLFAPDPSDQFSALDPATFGPAGTVNVFGGTYPDYGNNFEYDGAWTFNTATDGPDDAACMYPTTSQSNKAWTEGLHELVLQTGEFGGSDASMPFNGEMGFLSLSDTSEVVDSASGTVEVTLISPYEKTTVIGHGMNQAQRFQNITIPQGADVNGEPPSDLFSGFVYDFSLTDTWGVEAYASPSVNGGAISMYLLYDANNDGVFNVWSAQELITWDNWTSSPNIGGPTWGRNGNYRLVVYGNDVDPTDRFNIWLYTYGGSDLSIAEADEDGVIDTTPGVPLTLHISYNLDGMGDWFGEFEAFPADEEMWGCGTWAEIQLMYGVNTTVDVKKSLVLPGDTVTVTITMENLSKEAMYPDLVAPIPEGTFFVPGTLRSSDAIWPDMSYAWYGSGKVYWDDELIPGETVVISYQLRLGKDAVSGTLYTQEAITFYDEISSDSFYAAYGVFLPVINRP